MKIVYRFILPALGIFILCVSLGFSEIFPKDSQTGNMWIIQAFTKATLSLDQQRGQLKVEKSAIVGTPNVIWHFKAVTSEDFVSIMKTGGIRDGVLAILSRTTKIDNKDRYVAIPLRVNSPVVDDSGLLYKDVSTKMTGIPQNLVLERASLILFMPKTAHPRVMEVDFVEEFSPDGYAYPKR